MKFYFLVALILSPVFGTPAFAGNDGPHLTRNTIHAAGEVTKINGSVFLDDLVNKTVCDKLLPGDDFVKDENLKDFSRFMSNLEKVHWYFADALRRELQVVSICEVTSEFKKINTTDEDAVTYFKEEGNTQLVAVRLDDMVYINMNKLHALPPMHQSGLVVHELVHGFIPMNAPKRYESVKSVTRAIVNGQLTPTNFPRYRNEFSIKVPTTPEHLEAIKSELNVALDFFAPMANRMSAAVKVKNYLSSLQDRNSNVTEALATRDARILEGLVDDYFKALGVSLKRGDYKKLIYLLSNNNYEAALDYINKGGDFWTGMEPKTTEERPISNMSEGSTCGVGSGQGPNEEQAFNWSDPFHVGSHSAPNSIGFTKSYSLTLSGFFTRLVSSAIAQSIMANDLPSTMKLYGILGLSGDTQYPSPDLIVINHMHGMTTGLIDAVRYSRPELVKAFLNQVDPNMKIPVGTYWQKASRWAGAGSNCSYLMPYFRSALDFAFWNLADPTKNWNEKFEILRLLVSHPKTNRDFSVWQEQVRKGLDSTKVQQVEEILK